MVEDSAPDAELILAELERHWPTVSALRVETRDAYNAALHDFEPDVVLCDHSMGTFNAATAIQLLRTTRPAVPLIVVTGAIDAQLAISRVRDGAEDVVFKTQLDRLPNAIVSALSIREGLDALTPRQLQVLRMVAEGHTTAAIARRLQLSIKTVDSYRTELMERLKIHDVVSLVRLAVRAGLVSLNQ